MRSDAAEALAQDHKLRDYVELAQSIAAANAGLGAWDQIAPRIESHCRSRSLRRRRGCS